jgi:hypothetical protein
MGKRLKFSLFALPVIALSVLAFAGTASAGETNTTWQAQDPQTANIPYLAWAGNQVKITKCFSEALAGGPLNAEIINPFLRGKFRVEDWSGYELTGGGGDGSVNTRQRTPDPQFLNTIDGDSTGQIFLFDPRLGGPRLCFSAHVSSLKPGLAVIKLAVRPELLGLLPGLDVLAKHQFLVIWMRSQAPTIREVANADFPSISVGDPSGNGVFNLGDPFGRNNGLVQIDVNGNVPMGNDFAGQWPGDSIQLPDAWAALAAKYAFDDNAQAGGIPGSGAMRWDIHDDKTTYSNHAGANTCTPRAGSVDAVDNCLGGPQDGQFSFIGGYSQPGFGGGGGPDAAVGPFDQIRPLNSLLSDGKLDADDAPMPPLRVDVRIAAGGVGSLVKADKDDIYVRNSALPDSAPHNLYAPFYEALIPAVLASDNGQTSGVAGSFSNNFPGFQTNYYDYWNLVGSWTEDPLRNNPLVCRDSAGNPLPSPTGADHVAVYTDEHGEAFVAFDPDTGFNFATLNGACDLDLPANRSFSSTITATSIYPDQPVIWDQANKTSGAITKVVNIAASKTLNCIPKGPMSMFCVETVRDIFGRLQAGVDVRFTRSPRGDIFPDTTQFGGFNTSDQTVVSVDNDAVVVRTGPNGQAGVLIRETRNICIDVTAENLDTRQPAGGGFNPGVFRQRYINAFAGTVLTACGDGTGGGGGGTVVPPTVVPPTVVPPNTTVVTIAPSAAPAASASVVSLAGNPVPAAAAPAKATPKAKAPAVVKASLKTAQVLTIKGQRYLVVQLKSKLNSAKIRVTLIGTNGKVQKVVVRKVATNRAVIVPNLRFGKAVKSVKIAVM